ncbi:unnamed protein product [Fusarium equiseti]|uniref:Uncharacterized protein n=1 Tax=Fusarium equiseti TaxID=61235 RepID=A0A8J2NFV1_FUSEQ|nr:unnamed protein product [Fusarium equiseti]
MRAHGNVAWPVNNLCYNSMMLWLHNWKEADALRKINYTHVAWIIKQVELFLRADLKGVSKKAGKLITILVIAAYKERQSRFQQRLYR